MTNTVKLDGVEYNLETFNQAAKKSLDSVIFIDNKLIELNNKMALLQKAKKGYMRELKEEILSRKSGFNFGED